MKQSNVPQTSSHKDIDDDTAAKKIAEAVSMDTDGAEAFGRLPEEDMDDLFGDIRDEGGSDAQ